VRESTARVWAYHDSDMSQLLLSLCLLTPEFLTFSLGCFFFLFLNSDCYDGEKFGVLRIFCK
jgi:hypothetical protein